MSKTYKDRKRYKQEMSRTPNKQERALAKALKKKEKQERKSKHDKETKDLIDESQNED